MSKVYEVVWGVEDEYVNSLCIETLDMAYRFIGTLSVSEYGYVKIDEIEICDSCGSGHTIDHTDYTDRVARYNITINVVDFSEIVARADTDIPMYEDKISENKFNVSLYAENESLALQHAYRVLKKYNRYRRCGKYLVSVRNGEYEIVDRLANSDDRLCVSRFPHGEFLYNAYVPGRSDKHAIRNARILIDHHSDILDIFKKSDSFKITLRR